MATQRLSALWKASAGLAVMGLVLAETAHAAAAFGANLRLAPDVERAASYEPPKATSYFTSIDGPVYRTRSFTAASTGLTLHQGDRVEALAETDGGYWILVARNGVGVGYVARSMLCPTTVCLPGSATATPAPPPPR